MPLASHLASVAALAAAALLAVDRADAQTAPNVITVSSLDQLPPGARIVYVDAYGRPIVPRPTERPRGPAHGYIGVSLGDLVVTDNAFNHTARLWGYSGIGGGPELALDGGVQINRYFLVGLRTGFASVGGGNAASDGASLLLQTFDVDAIGRLGLPVPMGAHWVFNPAAQLELGGVGAWLTLRDGSQSTLRPRIGGTGILTFATEHVGLSIRIGYRYAVWSDAGGPGQDLSLAGVFLGLGLEVRL